MISSDTIDIILKYIFFCPSCNNKYIKNYEKKSSITNYNFICMHCTINSNLKNPKVKNLLGL